MNVILIKHGLEVKKITINLRKEEKCTHQYVIDRITVSSWRKEKNFQAAPWEGDMNVLINLPKYVQPFSALHNHAGFCSIESAMKLNKWLSAMVTDRLSRNNVFNLLNLLHNPPAMSGS